jgi:hypothetical protein
MAAIRSILELMTSPFGRVKIVLQLVWELGLQKHFGKAINISLCLSQKEKSLPPKLTE